MVISNGWLDLIKLKKVIFVGLQCRIQKAMYLHIWGILVWFCSSEYFLSNTKPNRINQKFKYLNRTESNWVFELTVPNFLSKFVQWFSDWTELCPSSARVLLVSKENEMQGISFSLFGYFCWNISLLPTCFLQWINKIVKLKNSLSLRLESIISEEFNSIDLFSNNSLFWNRIQFLSS